ncbi:Hypothetical protein R9X50_00121100 [Acrodontium crateriforme]|uniref:C2H2-type domain-containing protein n=1 Tax=Acrodontium crateriforme TaxID=150365 RepID=A0AAQ3LYM5_9PEZI|nr:Hypothetical protein R9X50_00121100 [Acrodontium crateriforme]
MLYEDLRLIHEDVERLEQAIAERTLEEPKHIRHRLARDHEISNFLSRIQDQSQRALHIYNDQQEARTQEVQQISTGDPFEEFYNQLREIKSYHDRNPGERVENLERAYKRVDGARPGLNGNVDDMFTGEESYGRFFDLTMLHEEYLNLPGVKSFRKLTYLQYLDIFDIFTPPRCIITRQQKMTDQYVAYVGSLAQYLESFMRRTKPLEDLDKLFRQFESEFEQAWEEDKVEGWQVSASQTAGGASNGPVTEGTGEGIWCPDCQKEFKNPNVYKAHLTGKKHIKAVEAKAQNGSAAESDSNPQNSAQRRIERVVAEREFRIHKLASAMKTEREDTRVNVERKAGMTDRERQQELEALFEEENAFAVENPNGEDDNDDDEEKVYNPLKLPLAWDGKPIPFWLYKLHGLGAEHPCEICGNFVYMGRRAFDKHFSEARHIYGLKCLGITNTSLFREITGIEEAERLWEKIKRDKAKSDEKSEAFEEMEDSSGNVMPKKVYEDLLKAGML